MPTQRIVRGHETVVDERIHQQTLLYHLFELWRLVEEISVIVVGNHDPIDIRGQPQNIAIVVTDQTSTSDVSRRREDQKSFFF